MMYKIICLLKRRAGTTREEFKEYYEKHHALMGARLLRGNIVKYHRRYLGAHYLSDPLSENTVEAEFDGVTEIWWRDRDAYLEGMKRIAAAAQEVNDVRNHHLASTQIYVIEDECESDLPSPP